MPGTSVTCVGEPLALVAVEDLDADAPALNVGGAEANVATGLASYDASVAFVSRVGDDTEGRTIAAHLSGHGVDVRALEIATDEATGRYAKVEGVDDDGEPHSSSVYRRAESAASRMGPDLLSRPAPGDALSRAGIVHLTGITPALSPSCAALARALLVDRLGVEGTLTFDVNWRPQLWSDGDPGLVSTLANHADVVLVGADEAEAVLGTADPHEIRSRLPRPGVVVVKDGGRRAVALTRNGEVREVPALDVEVVEPVGAGDSFAAGFLLGLTRGEALTTCLRRGHIGAAATLTVRADFAAPPRRAADALLAADESAWRAALVTTDGVRVGGATFEPEESFP